MHVCVEEKISTEFLRTFFRNYIAYFCLMTYLKQEKIINSKDIFHTTIKLAVSHIIIFSKLMSLEKPLGNFFWFRNDQKVSLLKQAAENKNSVLKNSLQEISFSKVLFNMKEKSFFHIHLKFLIYLFTFFLRKCLKMVLWPSA